MKRKFFLIILCLLLLTACGQKKEAEVHPEWDEGWTRFGDHLAVEAPEGFALGEYNDALSPNGIWYAVWNCGQERKIKNAAGEDASAYDAQIYLVLKEAKSQAEAQANVVDWLDREAQSYEVGDSHEITAAGQSFSCRQLLSAGADNPYSFGASAFGTRDDLAISAELLCGEGFAEDLEAVLESFLQGFHY